jgi:hypothetical protein
MLLLYVAQSELSSNSNEAIHSKNIFLILREVQNRIHVSNDLFIAFASVIHRCAILIVSNVMWLRFH